MSERRKKAVEAALLAFWAEIANAYPEADSGDIDPVSDHRFTEAADRIVEEWIGWNVPTDLDAEALALRVLSSFESRGPNGGAS